MECNLDSLRAIGIDLEPTVKRFCDDTGLLVEMLHEFAQEDLAEGLPSALGADDLAEGERLAHAVKGTSENLGLMELSARCNEVMQAVRAGKTEGLEGLVDAAVRCYRTVRAGIASL